METILLQVIKSSNASVIFPPFTVFSIQYKYGINYGDDANNGGGNDNEAGFTDDHFIELSQYMVSATVENVFGAMGFHNLINIVIIPVELTSFTASITQGNVHLNWTTATELNNLGFEIHRKIIREEIEGEWVTIGYREGAGTTTEPQEYSYVDDISSIPATSLAYRLKQIDFLGSYEYSDEVFVGNPAPVDYAIQQNYPNPFNPVTTISYSLPVKSQVDLVIYNTLGEKVNQLVKEEKEAGNHQIEFDATTLPSGVYFYRLQAGSFVETKKMVLLR